MRPAPNERRWHSSRNSTASDAGRVRKGRRRESVLLDRRHFLGAAIAGAALAAAPSRAASVRVADVIAIADYARPSRDRRFHLLDMASGATTSMLVAHGRGSDPSHSGWLQRFSNDDGSYASSSGAFVTGAAYVGKHGQSLRLDGLDSSNNNALERAIVIHTAPYVTEAMARDTGKIGRSQGCFTLTAADLQQVLSRMGQGRFLYSDKV
jgi:hypothetical protein